MCHWFIQQDRELRPEELDGEVIYLLQCVSALHRLTLTANSQNINMYVFRAP